MVNVLVSIVLLPRGLAFRVEGQGTLVVNTTYAVKVIFIEFLCSICTCSKNIAAFV